MPISGPDEVPPGAVAVRLRGLTALCVVINHAFLRTFPGSAVDHAPWSQTASVPRPRAERVAR
jgi:hypothetical protein